MTHLAFVRAVRRRMRLMKMTPYQLHVLLRGRVSKQTVYNFVAHGELIRSDTLATIMSNVGLTVSETALPARRGIRKSR
jgi:hypothetical protein